MNSPLSYVLDGIHCEPHFYTAPLNHDEPDGDSITLFARTLCRKDKLDEKLPWLLFLQGGPGFGAAPDGQQWLAQTGVAGVQSAAAGSAWHRDVEPHSRA